MPPRLFSRLPVPTSAVLLLASAAALDAQDYDLVIRRGRVLDGTGAAAVAADVGIKGDRIVALAPGLTGRAREEIDAAGRIVAPGFIDVHTHSENIAELPKGENFVRMGVTTIVSGNCGSSKVSIADYFDGLTQARVALNVASLVGHNTIRGQVMGGSFRRPPSEAELARMCGLVDQAMQDGAVGFSTGLLYLPGTFAQTDEIVALAKVAAQHGGIYVSHMRDEAAAIRSAIEEVVTVAREARIPAQISHLKLSGPVTWGRAGEILDYLAALRRDGLALTQDVYVYTASSTSIGANLIEAEYREGGAARFRARLADPATKARMVADMKAFVERTRRGDYRYAVIANFAPDPRLNGKNIAEVAQLLRGSASLDDQIETILDLEARGGAQGVFHGMSEEDLKRFLADPRTMVASDGGPRRFDEGVPHPRSYGNNARVLARFVRDLKLLTLEDAVRKMTSLPARTFHLAARGELRVGFVADVVIFDPAGVSAPSSYTAPHAYAVGFDTVLVNGVPVIRDGNFTAARPGRPVRRGQP
jgi:N-acyl-D-amino-acid deacylase